MQGSYPFAYAGAGAQVGMAGTGEPRRTLHPCSRDEPMSEDTIERAAMSELKQRGGWGIQPTGVATAGCPDMLGAYRGRALAWEFKQPGRYPRPAQRMKLRQAERAGAQAEVVRSRDEAKALLDAIDAELQDRPGDAPASVGR